MFFVRLRLMINSMAQYFRLQKVEGIALLIFTARKRSLRRLCFFTCLSVMLGCTPQTRGRPLPPGTTGRHPTGPDAVTPPGPEAGTTPGAVHAGRYGQQAGDSHPTGMHTCNNFINFGISRD